MYFTRIGVFFLLSGTLFVRLEGGDGVGLEIDKEASSIAAHVQATGHRFDAVVTDYELDLRWDPESRSIVGARLVFDFEGVRTGRARRDREMLEWVEHETHPEAAFVLQAIEEEGGELVARGTFSLYRTEQEIEFPVAVDEINGVLRIRAETVLDHRDWELEKIRAFLFMTVDPELEIKIDVRAALP